MDKQAEEPKIYFYQDSISDYSELHKVLKLYDKKSGYDKVVTSIVNPLRPREFTDKAIKVRHQQFTRSDLILTSNEWYSRFIFKITESIDCDSQDDSVRIRSEQTLAQELSLAEHYNTGNILVKLKSGNNVNLARLLSKSIRGHLLIQLPTSDEKAQSMVYRKDVDAEKMIIEDTWNWWNDFRSTANHNPRIKLALEFNEDIPSEEEVLRWLGEPIDSIIIPSHLFVLNKANTLVLPRTIQSLLRPFLNFKPNIIIKLGSFLDSNTLSYSDYIERFRRVERNKAEHPFLEVNEQYEDYMQTPLQPLYDNLDTTTYEVFEKDPVKYFYYQKAIEQALIDKVSLNDIETTIVTVMVVGAGRGPLVRSSLNAAANTHRKIKIYIVEKNPNAIVTLMALVKEMWSDKDIEIISCDMRDFTPPEKVDILVSELLGSFGDNELSPECLDGAQRHLKPDGISIPCEYSSYLNPVMTSKLYTACRPDKSVAIINSYESSVRTDELTYVVNPKNVYYIDAPQKIFTFTHPNYDEVIDNSRYKVVDFNVHLDCMLNGFVGYFDCVLYKDITLSIHPFTHTQGLISWFPLYIPITEPQMLKKGDKLTAHIWRCISSNGVWYEWSTSAPYKSKIHNKNGRAIKIFK